MNFKTTILSVFIFLMATLSANGTTFTVSTNANSGAGSLRQALADAAANAGDDTIVFAPALEGQTITLASEIRIQAANGAITVNGPGASRLVIDGGAGTNRVFSLSSAITMTVNDVTITGGNGSGLQFPNFGGAILVAVGGATFNLNRSRVTGNTASGSGGGLVCIANTTVNITDSTFDNNTASLGGGAIQNEGVMMTLKNTTLTDNKTTTASGGGGGILQGGGTMAITNSTISGNSTESDGGGIMVINSTLNLGNTIIAGNTDNSGLSAPDIYNYGSGTINTQGFNLIGDNSTVQALFPTGNPNANNDRVNQSAGLLPLGTYGGSVPTRALAPGSFARENGSNALANTAGLTTDARGATSLTTFPRIVGSSVDIGAYEARTNGMAFIVNQTTDAGDLTCDATCTLRDAADDVNAQATNDEIFFDSMSLTGAFRSTATVTLAGEIVFTAGGSVVLEGTGAFRLTVDGGVGTNRVFTLDSATTTLRGMTVKGGNAGSAVLFSSFGGGIAVNNGSFLMDSVHLTGNTATGNGGGIHLAGLLTARIINSAVTSNSTTSVGGGITSSGGTLYIVNTTVSGNTANAAVAGVRNGATMHLRNVTIVGNSASQMGGLRNSGTMTVGNSIIAGNSGSTPDVDIDGGTMTTLGGNLIGNNTGNASAIFPVGNANGDRVGGAGAASIMPGTFAPANQGGNVPVMALRGDSLAINNGVTANAVDPFDGSPLLFDARGVGFTRLIGNVDSGAFEGFLPTVAGVSVSGRVFAGKGGLTNAMVVLTDQTGNSFIARTGSFGYYQFHNIPAGQTVFITVVSKRYRYQPQVVNLNDNVADLDFYVLNE